MAKKKIEFNPIRGLFDKAKQLGLTYQQLYVLVDPDAEIEDDGVFNRKLTVQLVLFEKGFLISTDKGGFELTEKGTKVLADLFHHFKTLKKGKIVLDHDKINQYNELFPEMKLPSGKYARCSIPELCSAFDWFFKNYPDYNDWEVIFKATTIYLQEREAKNWEYTRRSKYFVRKQMLDKSFDSDLADYYGRILAGTQESTQNNNEGFKENVV